MKRLREIGLTHSYNNHQETQTIFCALLALPLLLMADIRPAFDDVNKSACYLLQKLLRYVERQWITKSTVGPQRLSVRDNPSRTNNVLESSFGAPVSRQGYCTPERSGVGSNLQVGGQNAGKRRPKFFDVPPHFSLVPPPT